MSASVSLPRLNLRTVLTTRPPVPDHVLPGLPVGAVGAIVAPGGTGKTMFLAQAAIAVASGMPLLGSICHEADHAGLATAGGEGTKVVLVVAEETVDEMHRRLHAIAAHALTAKSSLFDQADRGRFLDLLCSNLDIYPLAGSTRIVLAEDGEPSEGLQVLRDISVAARLVIVDPLRQFHRGDENDSWVMTSAVQQLQSIAVGNGCAVLVAHHTNKAATLQGQGDKAGASRGSAAFTDALRWQLNLSQLDDALAAQYSIPAQERRRHVRVDLAKANYIAPREPHVLRRDAGGVLSVLNQVQHTGSRGRA